MKIQIYRKDALNILKENRDKHIKEFEAQIQGWKQAIEEYREDLSNWINKVSKDIDVIYLQSTRKPIKPYRPVSYLNSYDRLIELISANITDLIEVQEHEYDQIIKNQFGWTSEFLANSATYIS